MSARPPGMPLVAANWKMNPNNLDDALDLVRGVMSVARGHADRVEVAIFPPFPWLTSVSDLLVESGVKLGAQNVFWEMSGAYTGEVSPPMLRTLCQWVIVGHSERRLYLGETDEMVAKKTAAGLSSELGVIMCVGELLDHYDEGKSDEIVSAQVRAGLASC
ncbi:MAG: triosephosphate isomerase, partial [Chloroflexi bacterium]